MCSVLLPSFEWTKPYGYKNTLHKNVQTFHSKNAANRVMLKGIHDKNSCCNLVGVPSLCVAKTWIYDVFIAQVTIPALWKPQVYSRTKHNTYIYKATESRILHEYICGLGCFYFKDVIDSSAGFNILMTFSKVEEVVYICYPSCNSIIYIHAQLG